MSTPAEVITALLVSETIAVRPPGTTVNWPVTDNTMPEDGLDNWITVYDTGSDLDGVIQKTSEVVEHPTIAVRVRALTAAAAYVKGKQIQTTLTTKARGFSVVLGGITYTLQAVTITVGLTRITQEEKNRRQVYTLNARMTFRP